MKYRAYGNVAKLEVAEVDNPLRFQGQYYDAETGLHYNRHRYYNPNTGSYLTPDPIKLAGGLNNYQYVNNPTGWVDPLGLNAALGQCPGSDQKTSQKVDEGEPENPDTTRKPHQFHTFHKYNMPEDMYKKSDSVHFNRANKDFISRMNGDAAFRKDMLSRNSELKPWLDDPKRNMGSSPPGHTWHHNEKPGLLQLVNRTDHSAEHAIYHPEGKGGREIWGGGKDGREGKIKATPGGAK